MNSYSVGLQNNKAVVSSFMADPVSPQAQAPQAPQAAQSAADSVELSAAANPVNTSEAKPEKKGLVRRFKDFVGGVKKFFVNVGEYAKGTAKGLFYGAVGAGAVLGADALRNGFNAIRRVNAGQVAAEGSKLKYLSGKGKVVAGVVALATLGYQLFKASLNASEKRSDVDHRWGTPHNKV